MANNVFHIQDMAPIEICEFFQVFFFTNLIFSNNLDNIYLFGLISLRLEEFEIAHPFILTFLHVKVNSYWHSSFCLKICLFFKRQIIFGTYF